jgi:hypothetical protein
VLCQVQMTFTDCTRPSSRGFACVQARWRRFVLVAGFVEYIRLHKTLSTLRSRCAHHHVLSHLPVSSLRGELQPGKRNLIDY